MRDPRNRQPRRIDRGAVALKDGYGGFSVGRSETARRAPLHRGTEGEPPALVLRGGPCRATRRTRRRLRRTLSSGLTMRPLRGRPLRPAIPRVARGLVALALRDPRLFHRPLRGRGLSNGLAKNRSAVGSEPKSAQSTSSERSACFLSSPTPIRARNAVSSSTVTPSDTALSSFDPASDPART